MFFSLPVWGQVTFFEKPKVSKDLDSTYYELKHKYFFSYFDQSFDSLVVNPSTLEAEPIQQFAAISNSTGSGYLKISYEGRIFQNYEISSWKIQGRGKVIDNLFETSSGRILIQGSFVNNRLEGVLIYFNRESGEMYRVYLCKKGKKKKILYDEFQPLK